MSASHNSFALKILFRSLAVFIFLIVFFSLAPAHPAYAIAAPNLISPANNAITRVDNYPPLGIPEFKWEAVPEATVYYFQLATDIGFNDSEILIKVQTPNLSYTPSYIATFADREYYWRLRVEQPQTSFWSTPRKFTVDWAGRGTISGVPPHDLTKPQPIAPIPPNNVLDFYNSSTFSWTPVMGASMYELQISSSLDGWNTTPYKYQTTATVYQPTFKLGNGTYYWRVVPMNKHSLWLGKPSDPVTFEVRYSNRYPVLLTPANQSEPTFTPTFSWTAVRGAEYYELEYSTDPGFPENNTTRIVTYNTTYTPELPLPNDKNTYWRVRAKSGFSVSGDSLNWNFTKKWYLLPTLLTPPNLEPYVRIPFFSWSPVPGANYYRIEVASDAQFKNILTWGTTSNPFWVPLTYDGYEGYRNWRVIPYDSAEKPGKTPETNFAFYSSVVYNPVDLVYPLHYYPPVDTIQPQEDRTVALPIFIWQRVFSAVTGRIVPSAYRLKVSADPTFPSFPSGATWSVDTQNLSASPGINPATGQAQFTPQADTDYFWQVIPLNSSGLAIPNASPVWVARFDSTLGLPPTASAQPTQLLRPQHGAEFVELTPMLEWKPVQGATAYEVQISKDPGFAAQDLAFTQVITTPYPAYTPLQALGQRSLDKYGFINFYWRVRALNNKTPLSGGWSAYRRFQIAAQSQWQGSRTLGHIENKLLVGADAAGDQADPNLDLKNLYATQDMGYWYFGFDSQANADKAYLLYIDRDHKDGSGANKSPRAGYAITTTVGHQPEYAVYIPHTGGEFFLQDMWLYTWDAVLKKWETVPKQFSNIQGADYFPGDFYGVAYDAATTAWAVGQNGNILRWNNSQWSSVETPTSYNLYAVDAASPTTVWAVGANGAMLEYKNFTWSAISPQVTYQSLNSVRFVHAKNVWIAGNSGTLLHWTPAGWENYTNSLLTTQNLNSIHVITSTLQSGRNFGFAVGDGGTILKWMWNVATNYTWSPVSSGTLQNLNGLYVINDEDAWAVGDNGTILHWDGGSWSPLSPSPAGTTRLNAVSMASATDGIIIGDNGLVLRWNGANWSVSPSLTTRDLYGVDLVNSSASALIVGERGANLHFVGGNWTTISQPITKFIEFRLPNAAIGHSEETGSYALALVSLNPAGGLGDSIPSALRTTDLTSSPARLRSFASVSEKMNLRMLPNNIMQGQTPLDPTEYSSVLPFFWDYPILAPWAGVEIQGYLDAGYSVKARNSSSTIQSTASYYATTQMSWERDFEGDNTYYWRARPRYLDPAPGEEFGPWSEGRSFYRGGLVPQNLSVSTNVATPAFSWSMVEGAKDYQFEVDDNPDMKSPLIIAFPAMNTYTPRETLQSGKIYYWHVAMRRFGDIRNEFSPTQSFQFNLPAPTIISPKDDLIVNRNPTLCWQSIDPLVTGNNMLAAFRYYVEVALETSFGGLYDATYTEHTCWTPNINYRDTQFFWRVTMVDGQGKKGPPSEIESFIKQTLVTTLVSPINTPVLSTPTFIWTPVNGAAGYRLEVYTDPQHSANKLVETVAETCNTRHTPTMTYPAGVTLYWRVAVIDYFGNIGPYTEATTIVEAPTTKYIFLPLIKR